MHPDQVMTGELYEVAFPEGGYIRYIPRDFVYTGNRTVRELQHRLVNASPATPTTEKAYTLTHGDTADAAQSWHSYTEIVEPSGTGRRRWQFNPNGRLTQQQEIGSDTVVKLQQTYSWATHPVSGQPYVSSVTTRRNGSPTNDSQTTQSIDEHGNVVARSIMNMDGLIWRHWTYEYLHTHYPYPTVRAEYQSRYLLNRMTKELLSAGMLPEPVRIVDYDGGPFCAHSGTVDSTRLYEAQPYCRKGLPTSVEANGETVTIGYYPSGVVKTTTGPDGTTTSVVNASTHAAAPSQVTAQGQTTSLSWDGLLRLTGVTGPNGGAAGTVYDIANRPVSRTLPDGQTMTWTYSGNTVTERVGGQFTKYTLDGFGRTKLVQRGYGQPGSEVVENQSDTEYDTCGCSPIGKVKQTSTAYRPSVPGDRGWTTYTYDILGRVTQIDHPPATPGGPSEGSTTHVYGLAYGVETVRVTSPTGRWKEYRRNTFGDLVEVIEPKPDNLGASDSTTYTYNVRGQHDGRSTGGTGLATCAGTGVFLQ